MVGKGLVLSPVPEDLCETKRPELPISRDGPNNPRPFLGALRPGSSVGSPSFMSGDEGAGLATPWPHTSVPGMKGRLRASLV